MLFQNVIFMFQKIIMAVAKLDSELKRNAVIVALKTVHNNLEIQILKLVRSFI